MRSPDDTRYIMFIYEKGVGVQLEDHSAHDWDDIVHIVNADNDNAGASGATKVATACGRSSFVTYARPSDETPNCIGCLAAFIP